MFLLLRAKPPLGHPGWRLSFFPLPGDFAEKLNPAPWAGWKSYAMQKGQTLILIDPAYPIRLCTLQGRVGDKLLVSFTLGGRPVEKLVEEIDALPLTDECLTVAVDAELDRREELARQAAEDGDPSAKYLLQTYEIIAA